MSADLIQLENMVRKGTVQNVDAEALKARVKFGDKGSINSGELHILERHRIVVPEKQDKVGDKTQIQDGHSHDAYITEWIPEIGSMVLCLMIPDGDGEGYILGGIK